MKLRNILSILILAFSIGFYSCEDSVSTLGSSLIVYETEVAIDSAFTLTGQPVSNSDIQSRTITQILGSLSAKEYGDFSSDFVTQFMPALQIDTTGVKVNDIDSAKLYMFFTAGNFTGDSIVPMGFKLYPLKKQISSPIYSNFDPSDYYDEADCWTPESQIYTGNALYNDSINALNYRSVSVKLPKEFAKSFYSEFIEHPETFATPQTFAKFFPGLYVKNSFGSGRVINFSECRINLYYKRHKTITVDGKERDSVFNISSALMAVTPEVVTNNIIRMQLSDELTSKIEDNKEPIIVAPASYDVELTFPAEEIIRRYRENSGPLSVINTLTMSIPVEYIQNNYNINPPKHVLLVLSTEKDKFFANNQLDDNKTSFLTEYNPLTKSYDFVGLRDYILNALSKEKLTQEDYTFTLTPVNVVIEESQSSYYSQGQSFVSAITPYVAGPAMCKLDLKNAKIIFTYSKRQSEE